MSKQRVEISKNVLTECLGLRSGENLVVVADDMKRDLAESIYEAGKALAAGVHIDAVVQKPDVYIDDKLIMRQGELVE
ncbi:hypothetical protein [Paenibacillus polymyxa]|uniref:hypothetical protein n=1 Tax=Paenibacillus polymyxa TaxID=1406 RepID=UPI0020350CAB|nr:hypothetical protein [Paenibacillus polymyxa]